MTYDIVIQGGQVFDGSALPSQVLNIGIKGGEVKAVTKESLPAGPATKVIDARGRWVVPGFIDMHTHYDAELEINASLHESLRHGVTTAVIGSCSLGLVPGTPEILSDIFCRVEAIPYDTVRNLLETKKNWQTTADYLNHLNSLNLGPNIASYLGHSALRSHVMGIERSLAYKYRPSKEEMQKMEAMLEDALDEGYIGLSVQTSLWDKMGGSRDYRSRPLPSVFARWSEYRKLTRILRRRDAIFQGVPNLTTRVNVLLFMLESAGMFFRKKLKTTVISMMDVRSDRMVYRLVGYLSRTFNKILRSDFKWQALPEAFDLWADGMDLVVFEEFGAGAAVLHLQTAEEQKRLLHDDDYRAWFKRQWKNRLLPKAFHRNLEFSEVLDAPDKNLVGKSFTQIAAERGQDPVQTFLDLMSTYGTDIRWYTVMGNDRREPLKWILRHPDVIIGFSDAGAHLRNMAHYNFPLRMLKLVKEEAAAGRPFMSMETAVHKLTGELADWLGLDAGYLRQGSRADLVVLDPEALDDRVERAVDEPMEGIPDYDRLVRRNEGIVEYVLVNGRLAVENDTPVAAVGREQGFGQVLRWRQKCRLRSQSASEPTTTWSGTNETPSIS